MFKSSCDSLRETRRKPKDPYGAAPAIRILSHEVDERSRSCIERVENDGIAVHNLLGDCIMQSYHILNNAIDYSRDIIPEALISKADHKDATFDVITIGRTTSPHATRFSLSSPQSRLI